MIYTETATVRHLESWCLMHFGRHDSAEYAHYRARFVEHLKRKHEEQSRPHSNNGLFGMSQAAGCLRANALRRAGVKGRPTPGDTRVTWEIGHIVECMALAILDASGFEVEDPQRRVQLAGTFDSAVDGILMDGPVFLPYPLVLSVKSSSYKSSSPPRGNTPAKRYGFAGLLLDGVRKAEPKWWTQSQLEMAGTGFAHSLILVVAKDMIAAFRGDSVFASSGSLSFYAELIPAEPVPKVEGQYKNVLGLLDEGARPQDAPPAIYSPDRGFIVLPTPGVVTAKWTSNPNADAVGSFNPCGIAGPPVSGCEYAGMPEVCS